MVHTLRKTGCAVALVLLLTAAFGTTAQANYKQVFRSGDWTVVSQKDGFTDELSCVVLYRNSFDVQVDLGRSGGVLYWSLKGKGGVRGYRYRIDQLPPSDMRLASAIEKKLSIVELSGPVFQQILDGRILRIEVVTILDSVRRIELDLNGVTAAYNEMRRHCPNG